MWGALSDESTGLSFTIAASPRQHSHSRVRVPWDSRPYFTVSDWRLPFSMPPTTRKATMKVFDPTSTRGNSDCLYSLEEDPQKTHSLPSNGYSNHIKNISSSIVLFTLIRLLLAYSLPRECVFRVVVQQRVSCHSNRIFRNHCVIWHCTTTDALFHCYCSNGILSFYACCLWCSVVFFIIRPRRRSIDKLTLNCNYQNAQNGHISGEQVFRATAWLNSSENVKFSGVYI
jgi:hypothetical protein